MSEPDPARGRWAAIQLARWIGVGFFIFGLLIYTARIPLPVEASYIFMAVGLLDALFMHTFLARHWKSRD